MCKSNSSHLTVVKDQPLYEHDCDACHYLGVYDDIDLYYCDAGFQPTVIARYSEYGPDYSSGMSFAFDGSLEEAVKRAMSRGLMKPSVYESYVDEWNQWRILKAEKAK